MVVIITSETNSLNDSCFRKQEIIFNIIALRSKKPLAFDFEIIFNILALRSKKPLAIVFSLFL